MTTTETQRPEERTFTSSAAERVRLYPTGEALPALDQTVRPALNPSKLTLVFADLLVVSLAFVVGTWLNELVNPADPTTPREYMGLFLLSLPAWPIIFTQQMLYRSRFLGRRVDETSRVIRAVVFGMLATAAISVFVKVSIGRSWVLIVTILLLSLVVSERLIARAMFDESFADDE